MKKVPLKNYIIYILLIVITILLAIVLEKLYTSNKDNSVLYKYLNSVKIDNFDELITENSELIIITSNKSEISYEEFEKQIKKTIENKNLKNYSIFLDIEGSYNNIYNILEKKYNYKTNHNNKPFIIILDSHSIREIVEFNDLNEFLLIIDEVFE